MSNDWATPCGLLGWDHSWDVRNRRSTTPLSVAHDKKTGLLSFDGHGSGTKTAGFIDGTDLLQGNAQRVLVVLAPFQKPSICICCVICEIEPSRCLRINRLARSTSLSRNAASKAGAIALSKLGHLLALGDRTIRKGTNSGPVKIRAYRSSRLSRP